jgi:hypothetical protein
MTTHPLIGGAKETIPRTYQQVSAAAAKGFFAATRGSGALALEGSMITLKGLMTNRTATSDHGYGKLITFAEFARLPSNSYSASGLILRRSV